MKRKRYTEDLEFKISDEEADDADAAGRDSPSNTSQSEQQVSVQTCVVLSAVGAMDWECCSWNPKSSAKAMELELESIHLMLVTMLWDTSCLAASFKMPCLLKCIFIQAFDV